MTINKEKLSEVCEQGETGKFRGKCGGDRNQGSPPRGEMVKGKRGVT